MRFLIRTIDSRVGGSFEHRDNELTGDGLTIGRATDQDIQLPESEVALNHARITARSGGTGSIRALSASGVVTVNDKAVRSANLKIGDVIRIGASTVSILEPPTGFDFAMAVERGEAQEEEVAPGSHYVTSLEQTGLRKRSWSWILFLLIAVVFFAVPVSGLFDDKLQALLRDTPLPDDGAWLSGPLMPPHRVPALADNCQGCHMKPFKWVRNQECVACHDDMGRHVDPEVHTVADLEHARCASCHKEHNEPPTLVRRDEALCTNCHADLKSSMEGDTELRDAVSFGSNHPDFRLTMLVPEDQGQQTLWKTIRVDQSDGVPEQSNLKFPHNEHLDPEGVKAPEGDVVLTCEDCHKLSSNGLLIEPITMEDSCRRCHTMVFDADDPEREVPHGDPDLVILALEEYYSREYLENTLSEQEAAPSESRKRIRDRRRRRPGKSLDRAERHRVLQLARDKAGKVAENIFEKTTCLTCHEISTIDDPKLLSRWRVKPVKFITQWMPLSAFNHYAHRTEECDLCHAAETSETSADVLMPTIETCRDCHGGPESQLETSCVGCHNFHLAERGLMD